MDAAIPLDLPREDQDVPPIAVDARPHTTSPWWQLSAQHS